MQNIVELSHRNYAVVDMDTGTVLGTNVCLVALPTHQEDAMEEILLSDSFAFAYAARNGIPLWADVDED